MGCGSSREKSSESSLIYRSQNAPSTVNNQSIATAPSAKTDVSPRTHAHTPQTPQNALLSASASPSSPQLLEPRSPTMNPPTYTITPTNKRRRTSVLDPGHKKRFNYPPKSIVKSVGSTLTDEEERIVVDECKANMALCFRQETLPSTGEVSDDEDLDPLTFKLKQPIHVSVTSGESQQLSVGGDESQGDECHVASRQFSSSANGQGISFSVEDGGAGEEGSSTEVPSVPPQFLSGEGTSSVPTSLCNGSFMRGIPRYSSLRGSSLSRKTSQQQMTGHIVHNAAPSPSLQSIHNSNTAKPLPLLDATPLNASSFSHHHPNFNVTGDHFEGAGEASSENLSISPAAQTPSCQSLSVENPNTRSSPSSAYVARVTFGISDDC